MVDDDVIVPAPPGGLSLVLVDVGCGMYRIERALHDGREWQERSPDGFGVCDCFAYRLEPFTSVEGSAAEMLDLADAVVRRSSEWWKRCAVDATGDVALFWSPRNSNGRKAAVPMVDADAFARAVRERLGSGVGE